jgi:MFS family permease
MVSERNNLTNESRDDSSGFYLNEEDSARAHDAKNVRRPTGNLQASFIITLALGWVMIFADRFSFSPILLKIEQEFHLNNVQASLIISVYFAAYVGFTIPLTILAAKYGFKRIMVIFFMLGAISFALAGVVGYTYFLLLLLLGVHGAGMGAFYPTAYTISTNVVPKNKVAFSSSLVNSGMAFGSILGLIVAGPVLEVFPNNWQVLLIILSIPTFFVGILMYRFVPRINLEPISASSIFSQYKTVLRDKSFRLLCAAMFCSLYGYWVILTWAPTFLQTTRNESVLSSGATTAIFAAIAIVPSILISAHTDRIGRKKVSLLILPLASLSIFFIAYSANLYEFIAAVVLYGITGKLTLDPIVLGWISDIVPTELLGPSLSLMNVAAMSSAVLAPTITGAFGDATSTLASGFYFGALVVFIGTLFVAFARERRPSNVQSKA